MAEQNLPTRMANDREIYCEILEQYLDAPVSPTVRGGTSTEKQKKEWKENLIMVTRRSWTLKYSSQLMPSSACSTNELKGMYVQERHEHASI